MNFIVFDKKIVLIVTVIVLLTSFSPVLTGLIPKEVSPKAIHEGGAVPSANTSQNYLVVFQEVGLPSNLTWSISLNGTVQNGLSSSLTFSIPNGSYLYTTGNVLNYVSNPEYGDIIVNGSNLTITVTFTRGDNKIAFVETGLTIGAVWSVDFDGIAENSSSNVIYYGSNSGNFSFSIQAASPYSPNPSSGIMEINSSRTLQVSFSGSKSLYSLIFVETGLASNTKWSVTFNNMTESSLAVNYNPTQSIQEQDSMEFPVANGSYNYYVASVAGYNVSHGSGNVVVSGQDSYVLISFSPGSSSNYNAIFVEVGLATGTTWNVKLSYSFITEQNYANTSTVIFGQSNVNYNYQIGVPSGYSVTKATGTVDDNSGTVVTIVRFIPVAKLSNITFVRIGETYGAEWNITLNGTTRTSFTDTLTFEEPNGTYSFLVKSGNAAQANPENGSVTVSGSDLSVLVQVDLSYTISFLESGLPSGSIWYVNVTGGSSYSSVSSQLSFSEFNGIYNYSVSTADENYTLSINNGTLEVNNHNLSESVRFHLILKNQVDFEESGLLGGSIWYVNISGLQTSGPLTGSNYSVSLPNGTYSYSIGSVNKSYSSSGNTFTLNGSGETEWVNFTLVTYSVTFTETGLPVGTNWYVNLSNGDSFSWLTYGQNEYSLLALLQNGSYSYVVSSADGAYGAVGGSFVVNGGSMSESVTFSTYGAVFTETGYSGTWYVNDSGVFYSGPINGTSYTFIEGNGAGSYSYAVACTDKAYVPVPSLGSFSTNGANVTRIQIQFSPAPHNVTFVETGLQQGLWYVNISGTSMSADAGSSIVYSLQNGIYNYTVSTGNKLYHPLDYFGSVIVNGSTDVTVEFNPTLYGVAFVKFGLPVGEVWYLNITNSTGSVKNFSGIGNINLNLSNGSYSFTTASSNKDYAPSSYGGTFVISGSGTTINVTFAEVTYIATFYDSGLPSGITWYMNVTNSAGYMYHFSGTAAISASLPNGSYVFKVASSNKAYAPSSYSGSLTISGANVSKTITFSRVTYNVVFSETGLPTGAEWYVNVTNSAGVVTSLNGVGSITFSLINGSYTYTVSAANKNYAPSSYSGSFTVTGSSSTKDISFNSVLFSVIFSERGLPSGTPWYVNVTDSSLVTTSYHGIGNITFSLMNGSYTYTVASTNKTYAPTTYAGEFTVNGVQTSQTIAFAIVTYSVTFSETGLPVATVWYVNIINSTGSIVSEVGAGTLGLSLENGSYSYTIASTNKSFAPASYIGSFIVLGSDVSMTISFNPVEYAVSFTEIGLPTYVVWYVNVTNTSGTSTSHSGTGTISFSLMNGSYSYTIDSSNKIFAPSTYFGNLVEDGAAVSESVSFTEVEYSVSFGENGLPSGTIWYMNITNSTGYLMTYSGTGTTTLSLPNGSYSYSVTSSDKKYAPSTYSDTFVVSGGSPSIPVITFLPVYYTVAFSESGLPSTAIWYANVTNSTGIMTSYSGTGVITLDLMNGTYTFTIASSNKIYAPSQYTGTLSVSGSTITEPITFSQVNYKITFSERGLSSETVVWYVNISILTASGGWSPIAGGSTSMAGIGFNTLTNGTYSYSISSANKDFAPVTYSGSFVISGKSLSINVSFTSVLFSVTFSETGLPSGTPWYVNITGEPSSGPIYGLSFLISLMNGSYSFSVSNTSKYYTSDYEGAVNVYGGTAAKSIQFTHYSYIHGTVTPANATLEINGKSVDLSSGSFNVTVPAGSYELVATLNGYYTSYSNVTLQSNQTKTLSLNLTKIPNNKTKTNLEIYFLIGGVSGAIVVALVALLLIRRRR